MRSIDLRVKVSGLRHVQGSNARLSHQCASIAVYLLRRGIVEGNAGKEKKGVERKREREEARGWIVWMGVRET